MRKFVVERFCLRELKDREIVVDRRVLVAVIGFEMNRRVVEISITDRLESRVIRQMFHVDLKGDIPQTSDVRFEAVGQAG